MKTYLKNAVPWGIGLSLALVIGAAALSFGNLDEYRQNAEWVAHTHVVIERLETLRSEVLKVENARRGYVLTGDPQFLTRLSAGATKSRKRWAPSAPSPPTTPPSKKNWRGFNRSFNRDRRRCGVSGCGSGV